jgi:hypothetical protein
MSFRQRIQNNNETFKCKVMTYKEYPWSDKTYLVVHTTGCGVVESPIEEREIVFGTNDQNEALIKGRELYPRDGSGWDYHNFTIHVNISTEEGKRLYKEFEEKMNAIYEHIKQNPDDYITTELSNGHKITLRKNPAFDGKFI